MCSQNRKYSFQEIWEPARVFGDFQGKNSVRCSTRFVHICIVLNAVD